MEMLQEALSVGSVKYQDPLLAEEKKKEKKKKLELTEEDLKVVGLLPKPVVPLGPQVAEPIPAMEMVVGLLATEVVSVANVAKVRRAEEKKKRKLTASGPKKSKRAKAAALEGKREEGLGTKKAALVKAAMVEAAVVEVVVNEKVMANSVAGEEARKKAKAEEERQAKAEMYAAIAASLKSSSSKTQAAKGAGAFEFIDLIEQTDAGRAIVPMPKKVPEVVIEVSETEGQTGTSLDATPRRRRQSRLQWLRSWLEDSQRGQLSPRRHLGRSVRGSCLRACQRLTPKPSSGLPVWTRHDPNPLRGGRRG